MHAPVGRADRAIVGVYERQAAIGFSWQITPRALLEAATDPDRAAAKRAMEAMMTMRKIDIAAIEAARRGVNKPGQ